MAAAAWEWRGFVSWAGRIPLTQETLRLATLLGTAPPKPAKAEFDQYLLIPGVPHNFKLRNGALEAKRRVDEQGPPGFSLWEDKRVWGFPLAADHRAAFWQLVQATDDAREIASIEVLMTSLQKSRQLQLVPVTKMRTRIASGGVRLEVADIEVPDVARLRSYCIDGYDPDEAAAVLERSGIAEGLSCASYPELMSSLFSSATRSES